MTQLDFFASSDLSTGSAAEIIIFPVSRMKGELRSAAAAVISCPFATVSDNIVSCGDTFGRFFRGRAPTAAIELAVTEFTAALEREIRQHGIAAGTIIMEGAG